jgi:hypothetical protein
MARPKDSFFNSADKKVEATLIAIIKNARNTKGPGAKSIMDAALEELSTLYTLINLREG